MAATISFDLIGNATSAISAFKKTTDASKTAAGAAENTGSTFKKIAAAVATGYAVTKVVDFAKESVSAASAVKVANKELTAVFANAGDTTGKFAKHAIELADSLGRQIGVSPTVIKGAEGILATFQNVSSATGVTSGVFDRATKAAADLAAAGFGDLSSNAKALGKALNDPVKYMNTLSRSGIALTKTQQDQIKAMVEHGDLLGAQKQLLTDVESRVGGLAATTATAGAKTGVAYEEMKAKLGTALLPAVKQAQIVMAGFFNFVSANSSWLIPLAAGIMGLVAAMKLWAVATEAVKAVQLIVAGATKAWAAAQWLLNAAMSANPILLIVVAIAALVAGIVYLATQTRFFQVVWSAVWGVASAVIQGVWSWIKANWPLLLGILTGPIGIAVALIYKYWAQISSATGALVAAIGRFFSLVFGYISAPFVAAYGAVVGWLARIPGFVAGVVAAVGRFFSGVYGAIIGPFSAAIGWVAGVPGRIFGIMAAVPGQIASAVAGVFGAIIAPFQRAADFVRSNILGPLRGAWNGFANVINSVSISTPAVSIAGHDIIPAFHWTPPWRIPTLAQGGLLIRSGLVYAHAGEVISPAPAAATARPSGPLVTIGEVRLSERVDVETFARKLAWQIRSATP